MDKDVEELKKRIMKYRLENDVTQKEMAKLLNVTHITLSNLMNSSVKYITQLKIEQKLNELEGEK